MEENVEISPGPAASRIAQELLAVAAHEGNSYGVNSVATTTFGPQGLAYVVPRGLFELWDAAFNGVINGDASEDDADQAPAEPAAEAEKPKRGRPAKAKETE